MSAIWTLMQSVPPTVGLTSSKLWHSFYKAPWLERLPLSLDPQTRV